MSNTLFHPTDGSGPIAASARKMIQDGLLLIPPDKQGAFVTAVEFKNGKPVLTAAIATRAFHGWQAATWILTDLTDDVTAGVAVQRTW